MEKNLMKQYSKFKLKADQEIEYKLPFTDCPWCGSNLFIDKELSNVSHKQGSNH
jgi:hypothetical protein